MRLVSEDSRLRRGDAASREICPSDPNAGWALKKPTNWKNCASGWSRCRRRGRRPSRPAPNERFHRARIVPGKVIATHQNLDFARVSSRGPQLHAVHLRLGVGLRGDVATHDVVLVIL